MAAAGIDKEELFKKAKKILKQNDKGGWTIPAHGLYPHQWLWDSCFIAIGLRHVDIERAKTELTSLLRGQWSNGMLPNIIFTPRVDPERENRFRSSMSPYSPNNLATSGITQPPMLAEAVVRVGQKMKLSERRSWYKDMLEPLINSHEWLYNERDPHHEGLVVLLHPYESGLDNTPPWISELRKHNMPLWIRLIEKLDLGWIVSLFRTDTKFVDANQRVDNINALGYWAAMWRLKRKAYNWEAILPRALFAVEDLIFNCILIRANRYLMEMAKLTGKQLPEDLLRNMEKTEKALEQLWDESSGQYYSRSFVSNKLIEEPTIATFMPLYSGAISKDQATALVNLLKNRKLFATSWPVPTVPLNSTYFNPHRYWQGPTWVNTNWFIVEGLKQYGFDKEAGDLRDRTLEMVEKSGFYEYFSPLDASPAGAADFSWTAALTIDLLKS